MKLNKRVELGIKAVKALKNRTVPTRTADLAQEIGTTTHFLEQIMGNLRKAQIVTVKRGPGEGHFLNNSKVFTAYDVVKAVDSFDFSTKVDEKDASNVLNRAILYAFQTTLM